MKKIITLVVLLSLFNIVFAQSSPQIEEAKRVILGPKKSSNPNQGDPRDVVLGNDRRVYDDNGNRYPNTYPGSSKQAQIDQINREYDSKINSIRNNAYLSSAEKERMIRQLEADRARRIRQINDQYYGDDERNDRRYDDDDRFEKKKYKKNNGKHLGWEKGKGNPHRHGGKKH